MDRRTSQGNEKEKGLVEIRETFARYRAIFGEQLSSRTSQIDWLGSLVQQIDKLGELPKVDQVFKIVVTGELGRNLDEKNNAIIFDSLVQVLWWLFEEVWRLASSKGELASLKERITQYEPILQKIGTLVEEKRKRNEEEKLKLSELIKKGVYA